jgi:3-isopropylmalate dehydrogenase
LLHHSLGLETEARAVEAAVALVLDECELTRDLGGAASTGKITEYVMAALRYRAVAAKVAA